MFEKRMVSMHGSKESSFVNFIISLVHSCFVLSMGVPLLLHRSGTTVG